MVGIVTRCSELITATAYGRLLQCLQRPRWALGQRLLSFVHCAPTSAGPVLRLRAQKRTSRVAPSCVPHRPIVDISQVKRLGDGAVSAP
jgi:hypothetical protein